MTLTERPFIFHVFNIFSLFGHTHMKLFRNNHIKSFPNANICLKKRTHVLLIHIDAVSKRLYMMLKKRPFLKKVVCVFLKAYMAVLKRRLYGLVKQMSVSLEAYINGCLETIIIWYCKTQIIFVFVVF